MSAELTGKNGSVDVLLTHSNHLAYDAKQMRRMQPYPPLGTLYAATALRQKGITVAVFDSTFLEPVSGFQAALERHQPKLIVIYEDDFNFVTKMCLTHMRELACQLAQIAAARGVPVIAHGSDVTDNPVLYLERGVDYILNGEAEQTLIELCNSLLGMRHAPSLPGLVFLQEGRLISSPPLPNNPSWASLAQPARDLIDLDPYHDAWMDRHGFFSTNVVASRGCPYQCNWCAKPISGSRFQLRAPEEVAAELVQLKRAHGVQHVWFGDDIFALDRHWVEAFADAVEAHQASVPFKIQSRADLLSDATISALKRAGCTEIWMGVESGSQKILNAMSKGIKLSAVHAARRRLAIAGIHAGYFLQFGYPGEGWPEILETIALVRETRPDHIGVSISYPLPGTVFFERMQAQLGRKRNWTESGDLCALHTAAYQDSFYHALRDALHAEVAASHQAGVPDSASIEALWQRVHALEPVSRNTDVLAFPGTQNDFFPLAGFNVERGAPDA